jgi:hypothetical protein
MRNVHYWWIAAFITGMVAVGVPYWQVPYRQVALPNTLMGPGLIAVVLAATALRASGAARVRHAVMVAGAAVPAAVLARVIVETMKDPTSHNLWPLEVIMAMVVGFPCAIAGALAGAVTGRLLGLAPPKGARH